MTTSPYEQVPETLRLADEWLRETQREVDRRNSAYDHYGMGNTPETLDPLGAKMAAELRRQHAENEALRAGYNAARLEIESLKPQIIPGVQWQCGPLASGFTAPQPGTTPKADSQPAPVPTRAFLERTLAAMEGVIDVADRQTDEFEALRSCVIDLTVLLFSKSAPARDYPPLPMQFACSGVFPVYSADQMRAYVDADRAARTPADSQPTPVPRWDEMIRQQFPDMLPKGWSDTLIRRYMTRELDAHRAARTPADSVTAPAGERENLALRRMLCVAHAGAAAYMDDGEAQDSRELPIIDFLRDTPDEIQDKLQKRMLNKLPDGTASKQGGV